jgi:PEP-CTERM motif
MRNTTLLFSTIASALVISLMAVTPAHATLIPVVASASASAIVQPAGPRSPVPGNGSNFFNLEGSSNAANSSFGVLDFNFSSLNLGGTATNVVGATLDLTENNSAFTAPGPVSVYLSTATGVSILPTNTTLNYNGTNNGLASVDTDLGTLTLLGSGTFNSTGTANNGSQDFYSITFSGTALTSILNTLNSHGTLRLVMTPDAATTAATWNGFTATSGTPQLGFFAVVPEPTSLTLLGLGGLLLVGRRVVRKK